MKKSKKPAQTKRPKGSYPLPTGGYVVRRGPITSIRRDPPDMDKLAEAFLYLAEQLGAPMTSDQDPSEKKSRL